MPQSELAPECMEKKIDDPSFPYWLSEKERVSPKKFYVSLAGLTRVLVSVIPLCRLLKKNVIARKKVFIYFACFVVVLIVVTSSHFAVQDGVDHSCAQERRSCRATKIVEIFLFSQEDEGGLDNNRVNRLKWMLKHTVGVFHLVHQPSVQSH